MSLPNEKPDELESQRLPIEGGAEQTISDSMSHYHLALFLPDISLNREVVRVVQQMLDKEVDSDPQSTRIDLWIDSPGGDAHAAYKLALDLRSRCCELNAIVPDYAKSAATLLALSSRHIYMNPSAELGPLDTQIEHPDKEGVIVSALDVANSLTVLGLQSTDLVLQGGMAILNSTGLTRIEVLKSSLRFAARYTRPVIAKLDPSLIHRAVNQLKVAQHYAEILLRSREVPIDEEIDEKKAREIARRLVNFYPDHGYLISGIEAGGMGLPVRECFEYERFPEVYAAYMHYMDKEENAILLIPDHELDQLIDDTETDTVIRGNGAQDEKARDKDVQVPEEGADRPSKPAAEHSGDDPREGGGGYDGPAEEATL